MTYIPHKMLELTSASLSVNRVNHFGSEKLSDSCPQIHLIEEWKGFSWPLRIFEDGNRLAAPAPNRMEKTEI